MLSLALRYVIIPLAGSAVLASILPKKSTPVLPTNNSGSAFYDPPYTAPPQSNVGGLNMYQAIKLGLMAFGILIAYKLAKEVIR
jgi:hypothetical protein